VPPPYDGGELDGVVYLDTLDGTRHLLRKARRARRAVVIGGGITALEMAEGLARQGVETHYFVRGSSLWSKVFNEAESAILEEKLSQHGVIVHYRTEVSEILGNWRGKGRAAGVNMANGRVPYQKGIPFNVCLLFGLHITAIGQVNPHRDAADEAEEFQAISRGSSEVWFTFPRHYSSAWAAKGPNTLRLVLDGNKVVGALIVGEQSTADALRDLIEYEADVSGLKPFLRADSDLLKCEILKFWKSGEWRERPPIVISRSF
jgi:NAD(P)H-nitrite reductase large subunit